MNRLDYGMIAYAMRTFYLTHILFNLIPIEWTAHEHRQDEIGKAALIQCLILV